MQYKPTVAIIGLQLPHWFLQVERTFSVGRDGTMPSIPIDWANRLTGKWAENEDIGPNVAHPGYHMGQYMPPQQMPGPGMYQR
jgi:hypothetical protein